MHHGRAGPAPGVGGRAAPVPQPGPERQRPVYEAVADGETGAALEVSHDEQYLAVHGRDAVGRLDVAAARDDVAAARAVAGDVHVAVRAAVLDEDDQARPALRQVVHRHT